MNYDDYRNIAPLYAVYQLVICVISIFAVPDYMTAYLLSIALSLAFLFFLFASPNRREKRLAPVAKTVKSDQTALRHNLLLNQINPHFLYNTLDSIRGKALIDGNAEIADMVEVLSSFFRYNVSLRSGIVTLSDELNNVNEYLKIQTFRFGERFRVIQKIDERIAPNTRFLPKLTLQPIVENAIVHGLESMESGGVITIRIEALDDHLLLSVSDNGVGMDAETLRTLNDRLSASSDGDDMQRSGESHSGIALINIQKRTRMLFGAEYGLAVYSAENVGTTVELLIPKLDMRDIVEDSSN